MFNNSSHDVGMSCAIGMIFNILEFLGFHLLLSVVLCFFFVLIMSITLFVVDSIRFVLVLLGLASIWLNIVLNAFTQVHRGARFGPPR